ncbi:MAG TPA: hypothetical protein VEJ16_13060, partial [Alphaproteobacteria bacterium]|nr:hypothetical protein [Alphaproteobacteria bacterium]
MPKRGYSGVEKLQVTLVALPRNHLYRTAIRLRCDALHPCRELNHVRDLAHELNHEAVFGRVYLNAFDEVAQDLERFGLCARIGKRGLQ